MEHIFRLFHPEKTLVTITNKGNNKITELRICIQTSYDQNVQLILKNYLPVVYGTPLMH